jgi:chemotaxis protein MotB
MVPFLRVPFKQNGFTTLRTRKRGDVDIDIWPGFVDALSTVLLVFIFVLVGFITSQVYLSSIIVDKNSSLTSLKTKILKLNTLLDEEKCRVQKMEDLNFDLSNQIKTLNETIARLESICDVEEQKVQQELREKKSLNEQIAILTKQIQDVLLALEEERGKIVGYEEDLEKLRSENMKLSEIRKFSAYRSEFFDKLQSIVKNEKGIKIVGDRFIYQSELFFETASDILSPDGEEQIANLANVIKEIGKKIPPDVEWILRIDGHTDSRPISGRFASNWELSSARAISVVKSLIRRGINPKHLVAAGFGEHQPISSGKTEEDFAKNRRIEFKLDAK